MSSTFTRANKSEFYSCIKSLKREGNKKSKIILLTSKRNYLNGSYWKNSTPITDFSKKALKDLLYNKNLYNTLFIRVNYREYLRRKKNG
jgi:hypothetical protein